ncbi:hypothetical protein BSK62_16810 [Paenibacillus odorifer]|uniref:hypothetical protein n=1 Tax=Paenibacillus TaxID=44249 RepID=UPI00096CC7FB|nr:hypothetical protein [Paenibacillus odorifer]OMD64631.1 hypothetical protein BSK62_16810 [Paenibacillus odorifer]
MNNFLVNFHTLNIHDKKTFEYLKKLFTNYRYRNTFFEIISRTRNYEYALSICDLFDQILEYHGGNLNKELFKDIDSGVVDLRLMCLDRSDRWFRYLDYFETVFLEKKYEITYSLDSAIERFERYLIRSDEHSHYVHFLYLSDDRRSIIKRKAERQVNGKSSSHLKHHTQNELSDIEIERRYYEVLKYANLHNE